MIAFQHGSFESQSAGNFVKIVIHASTPRIVSFEYDGNSEYREHLSGLVRLSLPHTHYYPLNLQLCVTIVKILLQRVVSNVILLPDPIPRYAPFA
jgi:hypothetical protein